MSTNNFPLVWNSEADDGLLGSLFPQGNTSNLAGEDVGFPIQILQDLKLLNDPSKYIILGLTFSYSQDIETTESFYNDNNKVDKNGFHLHYTKNSKKLFLLYIGLSFLKYLENKLSKDKLDIYNKIYEFCKAKDPQFPFAIDDIQANFDRKIQDLNFLRENEVLSGSKIYANTITKLKYILKNPNDQKSIELLTKINILVSKMDIEAQATFSKISNFEANPYENFLVGKKESFSYDDLQKLFMQLSKMQESVKKLKAANFKTATEFVEFSNKFFVAKNDSQKFLIQYPFINIGIEERKKLLKLFADDNENITTRWSVDSDIGSAELLLTLLYYCKDEERLQIILEFEKNKTLYKLFSLCYYDCYNKLAVLVGNTYLKSIEAQKAELTNQAIEEGNSIYFNTNLFGTHNIESFDDKEKKITFEIKENLLLSLFDSKGVSGVVKKWIEEGTNTFKSSFGKKSYSPLDLIVLTPIVDVEYAGTAFSKGEPYLMPACLAYYFFKEETKDVALTVFNISFQIALCFIGVGAVVTAIRAGSVAAAVLGVTDIAVGVGGVVINTVPEIERNHPDFVKYYNYFTWIYMVTRIVGSAGKVFRDKKKVLKDENSSAGMADNLNVPGIKIKVEEFETGLLRLSKIRPRDAFKHLDEAIIYFNHHVIDGKILQIGDKNCVNVVECVEEFLKTGKIRSAKPSKVQNIEKLQKIFKNDFLTQSIPSTKNVMKEGERGIIYGIKENPNATNHVFNVIKKDGELIFIDGQIASGKANLRAGYKEFKYLKTN